MHDHNTSQLVQIAPLRPQVQQIPHLHKPHDHVTKFLVGLDIGSTTVKAVIVDAATDQVLWQDYQRHETKQPEKSLEFLKRMEAEVGINRRNTRMFVTGWEAAESRSKSVRNSCKKSRQFPLRSKSFIPKSIR